MPWDMPPPPPDLGCVVQPAPAVRGGEPRPASLGSVVSDVHPLRVHWTQAGDEALAETVLGYAETAWDVQVDALGFAPPVLPDAEDGPELDIYLADLGEWEGFTIQEEWEDSNGGDGRMSASAWIAFDRSLPDEWVGPYTVHEFNHALQIATDFTEEGLPIWEATAAAAQAWTLGTDGFWDADVGDFQATPWISSLTGEGSEELDNWFFEYGAALWMKHLDEVVGLGAFAGPLLWEAAAQEGWEPEPDVVDAFAALAADGDLAAALDGLAVTRVLVGEHHRADGLEDAASWLPEEAPRMSPWDPARDGAEYTHVEPTGQWFRWFVRRGPPAEVSVTSEGDVSVVLIALTDEGVVVDREAVIVESGDRIWIAASAVPSSWDAEDGRDPVPFSVSLGYERLEQPTPDGDGCSDCGGSAALLPLLVLPAVRRRSRDPSAW